MKLVQVKLKNFRCYQQEVSIDINDLTAIIGKNDIGKSSVLEALDCFFNDKIDQSDLSNNADTRSIEITCSFSEIPPTLILDSSIETSPIDECILNHDGLLQVKKVVSFNSKKSVSVFLLANHPTDERLSNLLSRKNDSLKSFAAELGVDLTGINKTKNPPIRAAIRNHIGGPKATKEIKVEGNLESEDNLKAVWSALKKHLPVYSIFKVDKALDDKDEDVQDPMKVAIAEALALPEVLELLEKVEEKVRESSTAVAESTIKKLADFDASLTEELKSVFSKEPTYNRIFDLTLLNAQDIPLNKRGSGIRRLVLLSFFQAQAERRKVQENAPSIIYAIEEPETSQHPNHQRMLIDALIRLSEQSKVQVLFTTHSANLVKEIPLNSLRYISREDRQVIIEYGVNSADNSNNDGVINKITATLGILPNPNDRIKVLVYVEGNHDVEALKRYSHIMNANDNDILNLTTSIHVGYVITGGSALKHYVEHKYLEGLGKPEVHIYDNDVPDYRRAVARINSEGNPKKLAFNTTKLELENYLHHDAITEFYSANNINITLTPFNDDDDVPAIVAQHVYGHTGQDWNILEDEKRKDLISSKKKALNTQAIERMTVERIRERGGYEELRMWFDTIKTFAHA